MNRGLWLARKNYLRSLVKRLSDCAGGDDDAFIDEHLLQVLESCPDIRIESEIRMYEQLVKSYERQGIAGCK